MNAPKASRYNATVIVTSDTCYQDPAKDESGHYVKQRLETLEFNQVTKLIVEDDKNSIINILKSSLEDTKNALIITVGGTGLCPRDVTPEATSVLYEKNCSGIATALHMTSLRYSCHAALSRLTAGIARNCLIINFPGSLKACKECLACLEGFLFHALEQIHFDADAIRHTHSAMHNSSKDIKSLAKRPKVNHEPVASSVNNVIHKSRVSDITSALSDLTKDLSINEKTLKPSTSKDDQTPDLIQFNQPESSHVNDCPVPDSSQYKTPQSSPSKRINSPYSIIDYNQALKIMGQFSHELCQNEISKVRLTSLQSLYDQLGNVLAEDLRSLILVPPFPVSKMDGYVINITPRMKNMLASIGKIHAQLVEGLAQFEAMQEDNSALHHFICYQINTGGRLPLRDFAVIPYEKTGPIIDKGQKKLVPIYDLLKIKPDQFIRPAGSDMNMDDILPAGTQVGPVELSIIQSMGHRYFLCVKKPCIGVLSTGDELIESHSFSVDTDKVIDINGPLLASFFSLEQYRVVNCGISKDRPDDISTNIKKNLTKCDVLIITGGASMGTRDFVKPVIEELGGVIHFGRVNIKPGKPAGFSSITVDGKRKFIFTLPGNPVSAYVTSIVLVLPFLRHNLLNKFNANSSLSIKSIGDIITVEIGKILDEDETSSYKLEGRLEFIRAKFDEPDVRRSKLPYLVTVSLKQQSSRMLSFLGCDCLIIIDPINKGLKFSKGQIYQALQLKY